MIQNLKDEEAIVTLEDRAGIKSRSIILQMCYILRNSSNEALLVCESSKTRLSHMLISASDNKNITIENIKDIAFQINSSIVVLSEVGPFLFCWLICPNKNMRIEFLPFAYKTELRNGDMRYVGLEVTSIEQLNSSETLNDPRKFLTFKCLDAAFQSEKGFQNV